MTSEPMLTSKSPTIQTSIMTDVLTLSSWSSHFQFPTSSTSSLMLAGSPVPVSTQSIWTLLDLTVSRVFMSVCPFLPTGMFSRPIILERESVRMLTGMREPEVIFLAASRTASAVAFAAASRWEKFAIHAFCVSPYSASTEGASEIFVLFRRSP